MNAMNSIKNNVYEHDVRIQTFVKKLDLPPLAYAVLKTFDDCRMFFRKYYKKNTYAIDDLLDYRKDKIKSLNVSLEQFLEMCEEYGIKYGFENTFLQPISQQQAKFIEKAIRNGKVTLEYIYTSFHQNINKNILQYVL